jgi:5-hydroxyisourate hydrolase/2-oxo-4-hydroxy-4-carboxy-5-ureidoimidazoline decarboxylase
MIMTLNEFNSLAKDKAAEMLLTCCGSQAWVSAMLASGPFTDVSVMAKQAGKIWYESCKEPDWLEAFSHHPRIGDMQSLKEKFASTAHLAGDEQAAVQEASDEIIRELANANLEYEKKHGFIFIVSASGKTANEMVGLLKYRLNNSAADEKHIAMGEQQKITLIRLKKLIEADWSALKLSHITTHILDTSSGKPARGVLISLKDAEGKVISCGITNKDGRIADLLPNERTLPAGVYRMMFETGIYFSGQGQRSFYPSAEICFEVFDNSHYHIPLLLSPFGYTTYRGS